MDIQQAIPATDGKFGTDGIMAAVDLANTIYDGYSDVTEDGKVDVNDSFVLFSIGPRLLSAGKKLYEHRADIDDELTDLSEGEKTRIVTRAGQRIEDPAYVKILRGALDITDGVSELAGKGGPQA
jgi:hypothetical protein